MPQYGTDTVCEVEARGRFVPFAIRDDAPVNTFRGTVPLRVRQFPASARVLATGTMTLRIASTECFQIKPMLS